MGEKRHWLVRFVGEIVVLVLLATALVSYRFDLGQRWFGWGADPRTNPSAVPPPEGLQLPAAGAAPAVARTGRAVAVDPEQVARTVQPLLRRKVLGRHYGVLVTDLRTGRPVYSQGAPVVTPASTTKLLTATAALESLGPMARFRTAVRWVPERRQLVLVGGGDPYLASTASKARESSVGGADIATLARLTVRRLRELEVRRVRLAYDDSTFTGPAVNPAWPATYVPEGVVPPITALWVDQGRSPSGTGYVEDPSARAAAAFAAALRRQGLGVGRSVTRGSAPPETPDVASVASEPVGEIVERTLAVSDNQAAEVLTRHVGLAERQEGSFEAGTAAVLDVARDLGVPVDGDRLYDGSGLSRLNRLRLETLVGVVGLSASSTHPQLRQAFTGLPVAGFTGSLAYRFDTGPDQARGRVRAKTGTLTGVHGLAGVANDPSGSRMAFAVIADRVRPEKTLEARLRIDRIAGALGACSCGVGSGP